MAAYNRKTVTLSTRKVVNTAQKIQRDYYNKMREFMATASDEQIDLIAGALGKADTLGAFAVEQEIEARKEQMLGFTVFEKPADENPDHVFPGVEIADPEADADAEAAYFQSTGH